MDKKTTKSILMQAREGDGLGLTLINGTVFDNLVVKSFKVGRGHGGVPILTLLNADNADEQLFELSTKNCSNILEIRLRKQYATEEIKVKSEIDDATAYTKDLDKSQKLKSMLEKLVGTEPYSFGLKLESSIPRFNGMFDVLSAAKQNGRWGQIRVKVSRNGVEDEFWTYRHGGVIQHTVVFKNELPLSLLVEEDGA